MNENLGPRILTYRAPDGREGQIALTLTPRPLTQIDLGDGDVIEHVTVAMEIRSDWFSKTMEFQGEDDLQTIFRAMWISGIYVRKICIDNGYGLYSVVPGDVSVDLDVFKA